MDLLSAWTTFSATIGLDGPLGSILGLVGIALVIWGIFSLVAKRGGLLPLIIGAICVMPGVIVPVVLGLIGPLIDIVLNVGSNAAEVAS